MQDHTLTASRAVVTDSNKKVSSSTATDTEVSYLSGVTSAIQAQLNGKADSNDSRFSNLSLESAGVVQLGADAASPVDQVLKGPDGVGTDKAGGRLTLKGGQSTGTGAGGALVGETSLSAAATGSGANSYSTRYFHSPKAVALVEATATTFCNISLPVGAFVGVRLACTVFATDGTDFQAIHSPVTFVAVNKAGTITVSTIVVGGPSTAVSSGTITPVTYTVVANGNSVDIKVAATSSLSQTVLQIKWAIVELNSNDVATVTPS